MWILSGNKNEYHEQAREALDEAGIKYLSMLDENHNIPELFSGFVSYVGLEQIIRFAQRVRKPVRERIPAKA